MQVGLLLARLQASCCHMVLGTPAVAAHMPRATCHCRDIGVHATDAMALAGPHSEELQSAAALLCEEEQGTKAAALLSRVLNNIISKPGEEKYR